MSGKVEREVSRVVLSKIFLILQHLFGRAVDLNRAQVVLFSSIQLAIIVVYVVWIAFVPVVSVEDVLVLLLSILS